MHHFFEFVSNQNNLPYTIVLMIFYSLICGGAGMAIGILICYREGKRIEQKERYGSYDEFIKAGRVSFNKAK